VHLLRYRTGRCGIDTGRGYLEHCPDDGNIRSAINENCNQCFANMFVTAWHDAAMREFVQQEKAFLQTLLLRSSLDDIVTTNYMQRRMI
jgi:hypothetical protein